MKVSSLIAALVLIASVSTANASIYQTTFSAPTYSDAALIGQDGWLITGTSVVNPIAVANTGTNGNVSLTTTGQDVNRPFLPAITADSTYLSADITLSAAQAAGDYFLHLSDGSSSNFYSRIYARSSGAGYQLAMGTSSGAVTYGATELAFGVTYRILARYDFVAGASNDTGALFVDPLDPLGVGDPIYVGATTTGIDATTISAVNLRQGGTSNAPTLVIDNINVVPEPATMGLLAIGALAAFRRRR